MSDLGQRAVSVRYKNWRGEVADRDVTPLDFRWGSTEWHPEPGWIMRAFDHGKGEEREFSLADCDFLGLSSREAVLAEAAKAALSKQGGKTMGSGHANSCYDIGVADAARAVEALK